MSETGWASVVPVSESKNLVNCLTVGKVCPGVEIKIINENEESLVANMTGQLCIRSKQVCSDNRFFGFYHSIE